MSLVTLAIYGVLGFGFLSVAVTIATAVAKSLLNNDFPED